MVAKTLICQHHPSPRRCCDHNAPAPCTRSSHICLKQMEGRNNVNSVLGNQVLIARIPMHHDDTAKRVNLSQRRVSIEAILRISKVPFCETTEGKGRDRFSQDRICMSRHEDCRCTLRIQPRHDGESERGTTAEDEVAHIAHA